MRNCHLSVRHFARVQVTALVDGFISPSETLYLVTELHELSLRELLLNRPQLDLEDIRLMVCHFMRGLNVRLLDWFSS